MVLSAVIIILREVLEAALIISLLLAISRHLRLQRRWLYAALAVGLGGAWIYASYLGQISNWFEGVGQEVVNASLQMILVALLSVIAPLWLLNRSPRVIASLMFCAIAAAVIREGSEIILYLLGFTSNRDLLMPVLWGGAIGFGIGLSVGALLFYGLFSIRDKRFAGTVLALMALVCAGLISQVINQLIQADWITAGGSAWDTSAWLPENSAIGQLLYALIGYEATPTLLQVICYILLLAVFGFIYAWTAGRRGVLRET